MGAVLLGPHLTGLAPVRGDATGLGCCLELRPWGQSASAPVHALRILSSRLLTIAGLEAPGSGSMIRWALALLHFL